MSRRTDPAAIARVAVLLMTALALAGSGPKGTLAAAASPDARPISGVAAAPDAPRYVLVLRDGRTLASRTRPIMALGAARYTAPTGGLETLPLGRVDVAATRAHPANVRRPEEDGSQRGRVSFVESVGPSAPLATPGTLSHAQPKVTMYSATWCGACRAAKSWLSARGVRYTAIDVDRLPDREQRAAWARIQSMTGRRAVPVIIVGGATVAGFDRARLASLLPAKGTPRRASGRK